MFETEYQNAVEKVSVSDAWRAETLLKMQAAALEPRKKAVPFRRRAALGVAAAVALLLVPAVYYAGFVTGDFAAQDKTAAPRAVMPEAAMMQEDAAPFAAAPAAENALGTAQSLHGVIMEITKDGFVLQADDGTMHSFVWAQDSTAFKGKTVTVEYMDEQGILQVQTVTPESP